MDEYGKFDNFTKMKPLAEMQEDLHTAQRQNSTFGKMHDCVINYHDAVLCLEKLSEAQFQELGMSKAALQAAIDKVGAHKGGCSGL